MRVPFNIPFAVGTESEYIQQAFFNKQLSGDGPFTKRVSIILSKIFETRKVLLTHSCTAALEMCAILLDLKPGDEVIMPSYTFVSTANAFVLRGAIPVFVDIDPNTQNIDVNKVSAAVTPKTKAVVVVHYAGTSCDMDPLLSITRSHNLYLIEDAAQAIYSTYRNKPLGSFGDLSTVSFHETKNISCGEGGCLLINNPEFVERAEIIREKGTNRSSFFRGEVDKYTWVDQGSSYLPGEVSAAFLCAQLENGQKITSYRMNHWQKYHAEFKNILLDSDLPVMPMSIPSYNSHNAHMYYLIFENLASRSSFITFMKSYGVGCLFHYVPLHSSPAGVRFCRTSGSLTNTDRAGQCLVRLPMSPSVDSDFVIDCVKEFLS